ncbi:MAG: hypothetical protein ACRC20_05425 [Segniliparus sp.]|uniref:hypothetical protein n=1 Tax=Segniliparus sp. TaxID=2804064 RepID=UPI003F40A21E
MAWTEVWASWGKGAMRMKSSVHEQEGWIDAKLASREADSAEYDAERAIDAAISAIEQAEDALVYALYSRKCSDELNNLL